MKKNDNPDFTFNKEAEIKKNKNYIEYEKKNRYSKCLLGDTNPKKS